MKNLFGQYFIEKNAIFNTMKKLAFLILAFFASCAGAPGNGHVPFERIRDGWKTKTITVKNGGDAPTVMDFPESLQLSLAYSDSGFCHILCGR